MAQDIDVHKKVYTPYVMTRFVCDKDKSAETTELLITHKPGGIETG